jgi:hypothetical protein
MRLDFVLLQPHALRPTPYALRPTPYALRTPHTIMLSMCIHFLFVAFRVVPKMLVLLR